METLWIGIDPRRDQTRVLAMAGPDEVLLKARLKPLPSSRTALPTLIEAIALWQGMCAHAVLVAEAQDSSCHAPFVEDRFGATMASALYTLDYAPALRPPRRRDPLGAMGPFGDLRQLLLFEAAR